MPKLDQESFSKLITCDLDLQVICFDLIKYENFVLSKVYYGEGITPARKVDLIFQPAPLVITKLENFFYYAGFLKALTQKLIESERIKSSIRCVNNFSDTVHIELI